jgi:hypothetical protein
MKLLSTAMVQNFEVSISGQMLNHYVEFCHTFVNHLIC